MQEYLGWDARSECEHILLIGDRTGNLYESVCFYLFADMSCNTLVEYEWEFFVKNKFNTAVYIGNISTENWRSTLLNIMKYII